MPTVPLEEILRRVGTSREIFGITQVLIQGGHNPNLGIEYEDAFNAIKMKYPEIGIHGLSASEVEMIARVERSSAKEVLCKVKQPHPSCAGAEILDDDVNKRLASLKLKVMNGLG